MLALARADARVLEGCHECLSDALATYQRLSTSRYMNRDSVALRRFETELLLALREKELQRDWRPALARARELAPRLPASVDAARLLDIADAVAPDANGRGGDWPPGFRRDHQRSSARVAADVGWLATARLRPSVRDYLALALDCSYDARTLAPRPQPGTRQRRPVLPPGAPPLIIYRTSICLSADTNMLAAARALVPAFHEAAYFAATRSAFAAESDGGDGAMRLLAEAYRAFPDAPGVTYMSGWVDMTLGDCESAVPWFDSTVAIDSTHEYGLLNRTICLSRLHRDTAAMASASRLIALRTSSTQQGYYWRAVSQLRLRNLAGARADIEAAKALDRDANALTLAGVIENEQNDVSIAEGDLREARALPLGDMNCTAAWTLGLVLAKGTRPAETADVFEAAMGCYDIKVAQLRYEIRQLMERPPTNAAYARRRLAGLESDSTDQRTRYFASAFNAAGHRANAGNFPRALELLDVAATDPKLADPVAKLREAIATARR